MAKRKITVAQGEKYGRLTVIKEGEPIKPSKWKIRMVICKCDCGTKTTTRLDYMRSGHTKSCGCNRKLAKSRKTHGKTGTRLYRIWCGMLARCRNKNVKSFKYYGAMGVKVCEEWLEFTNFYDWSMSNGYEKTLTIDRVDPFGSYKPSNCKWIPKADQYYTRRDTKERYGRI